MGEHDADILAAVKHHAALARKSANDASKTTVPDKITARSLRAVAHLAAAGATLLEVMAEEELQ